MLYIRQIAHKYKSILLYGVFGVLTTAVNVVVYGLAAHILHIGTVPSSIVAWVLSVAFAYVTNRKWVFDSEAHTAAAVLREVIEFFLCRFATGVFDWAYMYVTVDRLGLNDMFMKLIANVIVIVLNYVASKVLVFKKRSTE